MAARTADLRSKYEESMDELKREMAANTAALQQQMLDLTRRHHQEVEGLKVRGL